MYLNKETILKLGDYDKPIDDKTTKFMKTSF